MIQSTCESFIRSIDEAVEHRRYARAASIVKEALYDIGGGEELPAVLLSSADKIATLQQSQGDLVNAASIYRLILQVQQKCLSPQHPDIQRTTRQLERVLGEQGCISHREAARRH